MFNDVEGYLITWTVYGTFLQGDARWWSNRKQRGITPQPRLAQWHADRLNYPVKLLSDEEQLIAEDAIRRHCDYRGWKLWACNARTNHVHSVITAKGVKGQTVRDQLKANCTRALREKFMCWRNRPVWSHGGDCEWLETEEALELAIEYVTFAQDRKHLDHT